jgi:hypothetical protein
MFSTWKGGPAMGPVTSPQSSGASGTVNAPGGWHPTVLYMLGLVVMEIIAVAILSRHLLK